MSEEQRRTDETLGQYLQQWESLNDTQRMSPNGAGLKSSIVSLIARRNGDDAAKDAAKQLDSGKGFDLSKIETFDQKYPRIDGDSAPKPVAEESERAQGTSTDPAATPLNTSVYDAAPGDGRKWLPSNATLPKLTDADEAAINETDSGIEAINAAHFHVDPALAWKPSGAELPTTGANISTLGGAYEVAQAAMPRLQAAVDKLSSALGGGGGGGSGEKLIDTQFARIKPALESLQGSCAASKDIHKLIARCGIAANNAFHHQLRGSNLAARDAMKDAVDVVKLRSNYDAAHGITLSPDGIATSPLGGQAALANTLSSGEFAGLPQTVLGAAPAPTVETEAQPITTLADAITAPASIQPQLVAAAPGAKSQKAPSSGGSGTGSAGRAPSASGASPGGAPGASSGRDSAGKSSPNDLGKLLSQLAQNPMGAMPGMPQAPAGLPQAAAAIPQQAAQAAQRAADDMQKIPESLMKALQGQVPENEKSAPMPSSDAASEDRKAATSPTFTRPGQADPNKLGAPGSPARPNQLDADGRPADKDRDGKVDKDAKPLSKATVKPFDLSLDDSQDQQHVVKGVTDPRIGEMMLNMAEGSEDSPVSVLDAARAAGMDIESLGDPIEPDDAVVGDAVIGDELSGLYIGDGQVLTSTGEVMDIEDVAGEDGFVAEVPLPELPDDVPATAAEPPAGQAQPDAPAPDVEPIGTPVTDVPPPPPGAVPGDVPAPEPAPAPEPPPVAEAEAPAPQPVAAQVASSGDANESLPTQVAYEGYALGGPGPGR